MFVEMSVRGPSSHGKEDCVMVHGFDICSGRSNFKAWLKDCKDILISLDQIDALYESTKPEEIPSASGKPSMELKSEEITRWNKMDQKACSTIRLCLSRNMVYDFIDDTTTIGIWNKLQAMYLQNDQMSVIYIQKKLITFRLSVGRLMRDHINKFESLYLDCVALGAKFEE